MCLDSLLLLQTVSFIHKNLGASFVFVFFPSNFGCFLFYFCMKNSVAFYVLSFIGVRYVSPFYVCFSKASPGKMVKLTIALCFTIF